MLGRCYNLDLLFERCEYRWGKFFIVIELGLKVIDVFCLFDDVCEEEVGW